MLAALAHINPKEKTEKKKAQQLDGRGAADKVFAKKILPRLVEVILYKKRKYIKE